MTMNHLAEVARKIAATTFAIEAAGALALGFIWFKELGARAFYLGLFHSVSAFNNAGFDLFGSFRSLSRFAEKELVLIVFMLLVVLGGLGFVVIWELRHFRDGHRFSFHSRVVLQTTIVLLLIGFAAAFAMEAANPQSLGELTVSERIINALFLSVTPRTAGFATVNVAHLSQSFLFLTIILMFIGASPGSTGGGVKTTSAAAVFSARLCSIRRRKNVNLCRRQIAPETVDKAETIIFLSAALVICTTLLLNLTEDAPFLDLLFESASAFGTVGLSTGVTPFLSVPGKIAVMVTMFVGRLGPLTLAFALGRKGKNLIEYPKGSISLG